MILDNWETEVTRYRIYADSDFLYSTSISMYLALYPRDSNHLLRCIMQLKNKYVFYYILAF